MIATGTGGATATIENALLNLNVQDPANVSTAGIGLYGRQYNFQTPYTETMNLSLQYAVPLVDSIQAGYVGALGRHLDVLGSHNSPSRTFAARSRPLCKDPPTRILRRTQTMKAPTAPVHTTRSRSFTHVK